MKFIGNGATAKVGSFVPIRAEMDGKAEAVKKAPEGLTAAKYGALKLGEKSWSFILDEPEGKAARLYVDTNGDGDLTNDQATQWRGQKFGEFMQHSGSAQVDLGGGKLASVNMYRFDPSDPQRSRRRHVIFE
jgi:hypothetical protein